ncbi:MAG: anhydro-N-acetylmuramic acid kinase [Bacteroidota bacterium]|nr:anhydro-N-acetylmuramic acid kinase [Bacteroidota bacterium]
MKETYRVIGVMSGSSMDGVDLAYCEITQKNNQWHYTIKVAQTFPYDEKWRIRLSQLYKQYIEVFPKTHAYYGRFLGQLLNQFIKENQLEVDMIASHGHTIFHQPKSGFTAQIGDGAAISAETGLPVICDFRSMDIALGGQGAPLVPIGDKLLFEEYEACLNLGGIANISFTGLNETLAFDICPCNIVLNRVARWLGHAYDDAGRIAASADYDPMLLEKLEALSYYQTKGAKSLGREWINEVFWPVIKSFPDTGETEKMATLAQHIARQISNVINQSGVQKILLTGGGTFNSHLIDLIRKQISAELVIPDALMVNFKEALIFAFLGVLRVNNQVNVLSSVTGSKQNHIGGALYGDYTKLI